MSIGLPVSPIQASGTAGATVTISTGADTTSVPGTVVNTTHSASNIRVTNANTVLVFVRVTGEAVPVATTADVPLAAGASIVLQNPTPYGTTGIAAVNVSGTAGKVYFMPCEGGL